MRIEASNYSQINEINELIQLNHDSLLTEDYLISDDSIALSLVDEFDKVVGFIWAGLMANRTVAYLDYFVIHPEYRKTKYSLLLVAELTKRLIDGGVQRAISHVEEQNEYAMASAIRQFQFGGQLDSRTFKKFNFYPETTKQAIGI